MQDRKTKIIEAFSEANALRDEYVDDVLNAFTGLTLGGLEVVISVDDDTYVPSFSIAHFGRRGYLMLAFDSERNCYVFCKEANPWTRMAYNNFNNDKFVTVEEVAVFIDKLKEIENKFGIELGFDDKAYKYRVSHS